MEFDPNIRAKLIFDGKTLTIPPEMGEPRPNQMQGTLAERMGELCCRVCYDSLGKEKSRDSKAMHAHLLEVGHWSVYEHFNFTVELAPLNVDDLLKAYMVLANRPRLWVSINSSQQLRLTLNLRHLLEWQKWSDMSPSNKFNSSVFSLSLGNFSKKLYSSLMFCLTPLAPQVLGTFTPNSEMIPAKVVEPMDPQEQWITMFLRGSRGMSHEQVRHRDAISQRSTRYVDENSSPWIEHPLLTTFLAENTKEKTPVANLINQAETTGKAAYISIVTALERYLTSKNVDRLTARKQARGAARGYLGNALTTELFFSAPVWQWLHILELRCSQHADAEIRVLYDAVLPELQKSRYKDYFNLLGLVDSPDGIGKVVQFPESKAITLTKVIDLKPADLKPADLKPAVEDKTPVESINGVEL